jgi:hypothetical protein
MSIGLTFATKLGNLLRLTCVTTPIVIALAASAQEHPAVGEPVSNARAIAQSDGRGCAIFGARRRVCTLAYRL